MLNYNTTRGVIELKKIQPSIIILSIFTIIAIITFYNFVPHNKSEYKIVIDPGHGGKDQGATGASGHFEKDFTLQLSRKVEELSQEEPRLQVELTRREDRFISSIDHARPKLANDLHADLFISIHGNTFDDPEVSGTETYYYHWNSLALAKIMHKHVVQKSGFQDRGVKKGNYFVLKDTTMPAVLLEMGYLTHPKEEKEMLTEEYQNRVAVAILDGIKEYLNLNEEPTHS